MEYSNLAPLFAQIFDKNTDLKLIKTLIDNNIDQDQLCKFFIYL
jgi:hypothetical protein